MRIKYTKETLESMGLFSKLTGSLVRDCFELDETMYFVVEPGFIGKAIGKGGSTVKDVQNKLKKKIRVVEYNADPVEMLRNMIFPLKAENVEKNGNDLTIRSNDRNLKGQLIGRNAKNLNMLTDVMRRYFDINSIKVE